MTVNDPLTNTWPFGLLDLASTDMRRAWLIIWGLVAVGGTVAITLAPELGLKGVWLWLAAAVVGFSAGGDKIVLAAREHWKARRDDINLVLKAALTDVARRGRLNALDLAGHAFRKKRRFHRKPWFVRSELVRVGTYALEPAPRSNIRWTIGKGAIGKCWEHQTGYGMEMSNLRSITDPAAWASDPNAAATGLTYDEFIRTKRYDSVYAVPIQDHKERFRGCVSVTAPANQMYKLKDFDSVLHDASNSIWALVRRRVG